ncbi:MAG: M48 family metalloprotease [Pseudomonadota bacterium]
MPVASSYERLNLPQMGEPADLVMSPSDEKHIGRGYMRKIRQYLDLVTDTEINRYVQSIGERLVATRPDLNAADFTFFVVRNPEINAFALPGGYVGINSGLIVAASNEAELASVIAHETAHITQRHIARLYASQGNTGYKTAATILAAILLSQQSAQAGQAALITGLAASRKSAINYTRIHEYEADRIGIQLLSDAGYNPRGMVDFFEVLRRRVALNTTEQMEFLRTHPLTNNRISEAKNNSARLSNPVGLQDTADFQLHQMKLRAMAIKAAMLTQLSQGNYSSKVR